MPSLQLYGSVGPDEENDAEDVANVGNSLMDIGLPGAGDAALSGAWDNRFDATVKSFQGNNGLDVDGALLPGGPTHAAINRSLETARGSERQPYSGLAPARVADAAADRTAENSRLRSAWDPDEPRILGPARSPNFVENPFAIAHREFDRRRREQVWRQDNSGRPRISDRVANASSDGARQREMQFDNFLRLINSPPHFPEGLVAFADNGSGDHLCFDYRSSKDHPNPAIVIWLHEFYPDSVGFIAKDFAAFAASLRADDARR
ncbi:MAG TPA: SMI1/KNR4 family protein [Alphaproteobacteria bacterium]